MLCRFLLKESSVARFYFHFLVFPGDIHSSGFCEFSLGYISFSVLNSTHQLFSFVVLPHRFLFVN